MKKKISFLLLFFIFFIKLNAHDYAFEAVLPFIPENPIIVEAGACDGSDTFKMAIRWPKGKIHAFECNPKVIPLFIKKTSGLPNVYRYEKALATENGIVKFYLSRPKPKYRNSSNPFNAQSSLFPLTDLWSWKEYMLDEIVEVEATTLDTWAENNNISNIDFLWLDTQGSEGHILQASPKILTTVKAIKTEFSEQPFYEGCICFNEYSDWLYSQGFVCIYKDQKNHGDAAFVRMELLRYTNNGKY